jgi:hypothetical protein
MAERTELTKFVIQSASGLFPEVDILKHVIHDTVRQRAWSVSYEQIEFEKFKRRIQTNDSRYIEHYPVGSIQFVEYWLNHYHNKSMQPIEVPQALRTEEFLKRDYKILTKDKIPHHGRYFIKNVSRSKSGSFLGDAEKWHIAYKGDYDGNSIFSVSPEINILSEWRVYVIDGDIENISNYDGNTLIFPDIKLVNKMVELFKSTGQAPNSFSIDVAVTDKGTAILEIHPFASLGLYHTIWGSNLIKAYVDGIEWYKSTNYKLF